MAFLVFQVKEAFGVTPLPRSTGPPARVSIRRTMVDLHRRDDSASGAPPQARPLSTTSEGPHLRLGGSPLRLAPRNPHQLQNFGSPGPRLSRPGTGSLRPRARPGRSDDRAPWSRDRAIASCRCLWTSPASPFRSAASRQVSFSACFEVRPCRSCGARCPPCRRDSGPAALAFFTARPRPGVTVPTFGFGIRPRGRGSGPAGRPRASRGSRSRRRS